MSVRAPDPNLGAVQRPGGFLGARLLNDSTTLLVAAVLASFLIGALLAYGLPLGVGLLLALAYILLAFTRFTWGLALWVLLTFFEALPAVERGVQAAGVLLAFAALGVLSSRGDAVARFVRRHGLLLAVGALFMIWITISIAWSVEPVVGVRYLQWPVAGVVFLIIAMLVQSERALRLTVGGFVAGTVLSVLLGVGGTELGAGIPSLEVAVEEDRLVGGLGDPNFMASAIVGALVLAGGLLLGARSWGGRILLLASVPVLVLGLVATQSRGGLIAAAVAMVAALIFFRGRRGLVVLVSALLVSGTAIAFSVAPPEFVDRLEAGLSGENAGRVDLWRVAWEVGEDHPIAGVGLNSFPEVAPSYVNELESLEAAHYIAESGLQVHNSFLELFAETGVVGLGLFLVFVLACLRAAFIAARRLEALGAGRLTPLVQSVLVATIATVAAALFVSRGADERLWILLALGPAALAIANRLSEPAGGTPSSGGEAGAGRTEGGPGVGRAGASATRATAPR